MDDRTALYLGALLHDIGKFIVRASLKEWGERAEQYVRDNSASESYAHKRYSAAFVREHKDHPLFAGGIAGQVETLCLWHHRGEDRGKDDYESINTKGVPLKLLRIADDCASSERREDSSLEPQKYNKARLLSPFNSVNILGKGVPRPRYLNVMRLTLKDDSAFPVSESPALQEDSTAYADAVTGFLREFREIESPTSLLTLLELYLHSVPAQTPVKIGARDRLAVPDINLYDHSRAVAAIAVCLHDEYAHGSWKGREKEILSDAYRDLPDPCIVIGGDLSGIQEFIFSVVTDEKVARALKGRSFFVQLLSEVIARHVLTELNLPEANLLYEGGGNFYILAPASARRKTEELRKEISTILYTTGLPLGLNLALTMVGLRDFGEFEKVWGRLHREELDSVKQNRFKELDEYIFAPQVQAHTDHGEYEALAETLIHSQGYSIEKSNEASGNGWRHILSRFGYSLKFVGDAREGGDVCFTLPERLAPWKRCKPTVKDLPRHQNDRRVATFEELALASAGARKLGVLKLDVDNLGLIFSQGMKGEGSGLARIAALSRSIRWFFEGYLQTLLAKDEYRGTMYVIFSGGDDAVIVGAWDKIFAFAREWRKEFRKFTGESSSLTLSASLLVVDERYPVARFAPLAEERLEVAKSKPGKDRVNVFGTVLTWEEFSKAEELMEKILQAVGGAGGSRAIIQKIQTSAQDLEGLQSQAYEGNIKPRKIWSLAYALRNAGRKKVDGNKTDLPEVIKEIVKEYETAVFNALKKEPKNPLSIMVAARWAELANRQQK